MCGLSFEEEEEEDELSAYDDDEEPHSIFGTIS